MSYLCFFFNDTATTEIYTLSLHDALPISEPADKTSAALAQLEQGLRSLMDSETFRVYLAMLAKFHRYSWANSLMILSQRPDATDRKSTRLNSSHANISYAVFCLKKKNGLT